MSIFSIFLIPSFFLFCVILFRTSIKRESLYPFFASLIAFVLFLVMDFPVSWTRSKSIMPYWWDHFSFSLFAETLLPVCLAMLVYWFFRPSFFKKMMNITFLEIFLFFGFFFYLIGLFKLLYIQHDYNLFQVAFAPLFRFFIALFVSMLFFVAEKVKPLWLSILLVFIAPLYALLFSWAIASSFVENHLFVFLSFGISILLPIILFFSAYPVFTGKSIKTFFALKKDSVL